MKPAIHSLEFYSTDESLGSLVNDLTSSIGSDKSFEAAERYLEECKADHFRTGDNPGYWDKVKIFRVSIEIEEIPRTANVKPKAPKRRAGGKQ